MSKKLLKARVLSDMPHLNLCNGQIVQGSPAHIQQLAQANAVDPHPAAVKYLEDLGVKPVDLPSAEPRPEEQPGAEPAADDTPTA